MKIERIWSNFRKYWRYLHTIVGFWNKCSRSMKWETMRKKYNIFNWSFLCNRNLKDGKMQIEEYTWKLFHLLLLVEPCCFLNQNYDMKIVFLGVDVIWLYSWERKIHLFSFRFPDGTKWTTLHMYPLYSSNSFFVYQKNTQTSLQYTVLLYLGYVLCYNNSCTVFTWENRKSCKTWLQGVLFEKLLKRL